MIRSYYEILKHEAQKYPKLTQKQIVDKYKNNQLQDIINSHLGYIYTIASRFEKKCKHMHFFEDIYNQLYITLDKVVHRYSPYHKPCINFVNYLSTQCHYDLINWINNSKNVIKKTSKANHVSMLSLDALSDNVNFDMDAFYYNNGMYVNKNPLSEMNLKDRLTKFEKIRDRIIDENLLFNTKISLKDKKKVEEYREKWTKIITLKLHESTNKEISEETGLAEKTIEALLRKFSLMFGELIGKDVRLSSKKIYKMKNPRNYKNDHDKGRVSKYLGVSKYKHKTTKPWRAYINHNCNLIHLGLFQTEEEAAVRADHALIYYRSNPVTNFEYSNAQKKEIIKNYKDNRTYNRKKKHSQFKGVSKKSGKWTASIVFKKQNRHLGYFKTERDAKLAYDEARQVLRREGGENE